MSTKNSNPYLSTVVSGRQIHHPDLSKLSIFGNTGLSMVTVFNEYNKRFNGMPPYCQIRLALNQMGDYGKTTSVDFECSKSVTNFLFGFRSYFYTTTNLSSTLPNRNAVWMRFRQFINYCMLERVVEKALIPPGNKKLNNKDVVRKNQLIEKMSSENPQDEKTVVTISLSRNDDDYLDELQAQFVAVKDAFLKTARREIAEIEKNFLKGKDLSSKVKWSKLQKKIADSGEIGVTFRDKSIEKRPHLFRHNHPDFVPNALCYITNKHDGLFLGHKNCGLDSTEDLALKNLSQTDGNMSADAWDGYLARVTTRHLVPFFVYFLVRFPNYRMYSLLDAEIEGKHGIQTLVSSVGENGDTERLTIDKKRASDEKSGYLDDEAMNILKLLIDLTAPFRRKLKHKNNPAYKSLWLVVDGGDSFGEPRPMNHKALRRSFGSNARHIDSGELARNDLAVAKNSYLASHEELAPYIASATLKKLPPIQGILTWFESLGDASKAATVLGNTKKMTMDSYIPKPIQDLMNIRMIRRFQNLIICAATGGKKYMLEATDFNTLDELHDFLSQMLLDDPDNAPDAQNTLTIKQIIKQKLGLNKEDVIKIETEMEAELQNKQMRVSISVESLAMLFLYEEHIDRANIKDSGDIEGKTNPKFWSVLAKTLHRLLPNHPVNREFSSIYSKSLSRADKLRDKASFPAVS